MADKNIKTRNAAPKKVIATLLGTICFFLVCGFSISYFEMPDPSQGTPMISDFRFAALWQLWAANGVLGIIGGILLDYKRVANSAVSGLLAAICITGFTFLYLQWRAFIIGYEMLLIVPLGAVPGLLLYHTLKRKSTQF